MSSVLTPEEVQRRYSQQAALAQQQQPMPQQQQLQPQMQAQAQPQATGPATFGERALGALEQAPAKQVQLLNSVFGDGSAELRRTKITSGRAKGNEQIEVYFRGKPFDPKGLDIGDAADFLVPAVTDLALPLLAQVLGGPEAEEVAATAGKQAAKSLLKEFILAAGKTGTAGQRIAGGVAGGLTGLAIRKGASAAASQGQVLPGQETLGEAALATAAPFAGEGVYQAGRAALSAAPAALRGGARALSRGESAASQELSQQTGIPFSIGQETGSAALRTAEGTAKRFIGTRDIALKAATEAEEKARDFAMKSLDKLSSSAGSDITGTNVGRAVNGYIESLKATRRAEAGPLYQAIHDVAGDIPFQTLNVQQTADDLLNTTLKSLGSRDPLRKEVEELVSTVKKSGPIDSHTFLNEIQGIRDKISDPALRPEKVSGNLADVVYSKLEKAFERDLGDTAQLAGRPELTQAVSDAEVAYAQKSQEIQDVVKSTLARTIRGTDAERLKDGSQIVKTIASNTIAPPETAKAMKLLAKASPEDEAALSRDAIANILSGPKKELSEITAGELSRNMKNGWAKIGALSVNHPEVVQNLSLLRKAVDKLADSGDTAGSTTQVFGGIAALLAGAATHPEATVGSVALGRYLTAAAHNKESTLALARALASGGKNVFIRRAAESLSKPGIQALVESRFQDNNDGESP